MGNHKVLKTAGIAARYSMYEFIDAIKSQKIIWDRRHPNFHNRELRDKSWQQIGQELCNNFDLASATERQEIVKTLLKRWKNTRDSYLRIHRLRQSGEEVGRASYIYEKELSFLLDVKAETEEDDETSPKKPRAPVKRKRDISLTPKAPNSSKRKAQNIDIPLTSSHQTDAIEAESLHSVIEEFSSTLPHGAEEVGDVIVDPCGSSIIEFALESDTDVNTSPPEPTFAASNIPDPDQAFFDSIKPHMQQMSNERKLDFQIEVLQLLRNFNPR